MTIEEPRLKKLIHLLAISAGGGLLLGAGIRLGEKRAPRRGDTSGDRSSLFLERLKALEEKISTAPSAPAPNGAAHPDLTAEIAAQLDLLEAKLRQDLGRRQEERLEALGEALNQRLTERIALIEAEIAGQKTAVGELRECSLRTEKNVQKVLEGIERLVTTRTAPDVPPAGQTKTGSGNPAGIHVRM